MPTVDSYYTVDFDAYFPITNLIRQQQEYEEEVEQYPLFHWRETCKPLHKWVDVDIDIPWTLPF